MLLAVAELDRQVLVVRVRLGLLRLMFGVQNLAVRPGDGPVIFPARKMGQSGIEIRMSGRPSYYFWTSQRAELLTSLAAAGFAVSAEEQQARR